MTIKIKAPRAYGNVDIRYASDWRCDGYVPVRIVRESDWRKLMRLVRACEYYEEIVYWPRVVEALEALSKEKKK